MASPTSFQSQIYRSLPEIERADAIVERLSTAISLGLLKVGERLPPEAALSEMFGVGGATLRDALGALRERGIVETRRGRSGGTFVISQPKAHADAMQEWFLSTSISEIRDIGDEHAAIAATIIRTAAGPCPGAGLGHVPGSASICRQPLSYRAGNISTITKARERRNPAPRRISSTIMGSGGDGA